MNSTTKEKPSTNCESEYDKLQRVLICEPSYMAIDEVINEVQKKYEEDNINVELAMAQHENFEQTLKKHNIDVIKLPASKDFPEQVFTRDIGFTVGNDIFVAEMANEIRKGEEKELEKWLQEEDISFQKTDDRVEGGDVIIAGETIYVGISSRTSEKSVQNLVNKLPKHKVIQLPFNEKYLHLDCVFNLISSEIALIFPQAFSPEIIQELSEKYMLIEVSIEEQFTMGTNVLSIGDKKVISLPQNKQVNTQMRKHSFEVIEIGFSEIIKSGGSFRCCSMPIERNS